jgi:hypothetical protein
VFPEAEAMISDFVLSHLDHFSVAMLRNELITIIIPGLKQKAKDESVPVDSEEYLFLSHLSMQPPSYSTVLRWLHYLGYTHDKLKKSYYVDGHEHQEQKLHRSKFIEKYLELEIRTHRWVQMSIVEFEEALSSLSDDGNDNIIGKLHQILVWLRQGQLRNVSFLGGRGKEKDCSRFCGSVVGSMTPKHLSIRRWLLMMLAFPSRSSLLK